MPNHSASANFRQDASVGHRSGLGGTAIEPSGIVPLDIMTVKWRCRSRSKLNLGGLAEILSMREPTKKVLFECSALLDHPQKMHPNIHMYIYIYTALCIVIAALPDSFHALSGTWSCPFYQVAGEVSALAGSS